MGRPGDREKKIEIERIGRWGDWEMRRKRNKINTIHVTRLEGGCEG
jgi:hypothetical protein